MIVIEFVVFVVSSGLFFHERFRHRLWAVLIAGAIATGSSLLFAYDMYEKLEVPPQAPAKVVKEVVRIPVIQTVNQPPALSKPESCKEDYPFWSRLMGDEGITQLSLVARADGTVGDVKLAKSSGSDRLDDAAIDCVKKWHYRPGIKNGQLVDTPLTVSIAWTLDDGEKDKGPAKKDGQGGE